MCRILHSRPTGSFGSGKRKAEQLSFERDGGRFLSGKPSVPSRPVAGDEAGFGCRQFQPMFAGLLAHEHGKGGYTIDGRERKCAPFKQTGL